MHREREPGENPGLSRSGMQERPPSTALVSPTGKRRPLGAPPGACLRVRRPASCAGRAASGGSSPRGMGVWLQPLRLVYQRCASQSGSAARPPAVTTTSIEGRIRDPYSIHRHGYRLPAHRPETRTQARDRGLLGRTDQPIGAGVRRRDLAPRHVVGPGGRRPGLGTGEHLFLLRPDARHGGDARRAAVPGRASPRRPGPILRRRARQRRRRAAGNDQVVRHQLPLPGSRDRARRPSSRSTRTRCSPS